MRDVAVLLAQMALGVVLLAIHRRVAEIHWQFMRSHQRRMTRRFPRRIARWHVVGPLWLYRVPWLILGGILVFGPLLVFFGIIGRRE